MDLFHISIMTPVFVSAAKLSLTSLTLSLLDEVVHQIKPSGSLCHAIPPHFFKKRLFFAVLKNRILFDKIWYLEQYMQILNVR